MANLNRFFADVLRSRGLPVTKQNLRFMANWQRYEGGWTNNSASFNPMNSTQGKGASINSVGVKAYPNYKYGVRMTGDTIFNGYYPDIVEGLRSGNPYAHDLSRGLSTWVGGPNAGINQGYVSKIMGGRAKLGGGAVPAAPSRGRRVQPAAPKGPSRNQIIAQGLLGFVNQYAQTGEVGSNAVAKLMGAVDRAGSVEPPSYKQAQAGPRRTPLAGGIADKVLAAAHTQVGKPYVFGSGPDTSSFDCSDLIQWAYKQVGIDIPRVTGDQIKVGKHVPWGKFQPGDLIFSNGGGHVVMYVGGGKVIAAPRTGTVVQYQPVSRFKNSFVGARRIIQ